MGSLYKVVWLLILNGHMYLSSILVECGSKNEPQRHMFRRLDYVFKTLLPILGFINQRNRGACWVGGRGMWSFYGQQIFDNE